MSEWQGEQIWERRGMRKGRWGSAKTAQEHEERNVSS